MTLSLWGNLRSLIVIPFALLVFTPYSIADCPRESINSYEDIKNIIIHEKISTPTALFLCLPEEYRNNYTLKYESESPEGHDVSPSRPRIISFGRDAKFLFALTGKEGGKHQNKIQI